MKRYIILIEIITLSIIFPNNIEAQESHGLINRTASFPQVVSPNAASFNKYIDNPIGLYNGIPDVNIPLYTLKDGAIELPIALRYNTSGIKVDEEASWVGLGWNLNMGGVIVQNIVGDYDSNDTEYLNILNKLNINTTTIYGYSSPTYTEAFHKYFYPYIEYGNKFSGKLNPDVFYYSYPGGSGKFIIDARSDKIHLLSRENNIKIEITERSISSPLKDILTFKITTAEGIKHTFKYQVSMEDKNKPLNPISSRSYFLVSSTYPNSQVITYEYDTYPIRKFYRSDFCQSVLTYGYSYSGEKPGDIYINYNLSTHVGKEFYLKQIRTLNYTIDFNKDDRLDLMYGKKLNSIKIFSAIANQDKTKEFFFSYEYFEGSNALNSWSPELYTSNESGYDPKLAWDKVNHGLKRLKLLNVYQKKDTQISDKFEFDYDPTPLPNKKSFAIDYWGYYNNKGGNTLLPKIEDMAWGHVFNKAEEYSIVKSFESYGSRYKDNVSDRRSDPKYAQAGILKGVKYPTGGYTEFVYESNEFRHYPIPIVGETVSAPPAQTTLSVQDMNSTHTKSQSVVIENQSEAVLTLYSTRGSNTWADMTGSTARLVFHNGSGSGLVVQTFDPLDYSSGQSPNDASRTIVKQLTLQKGTYILEVELPDKLGNQDGASGKHGNVSATLVIQNNVTVKEMNVKGCGLRINSLKSYESKENKVLLTSTDYEYKKPLLDESSGILHEILRNAITYNTTFNVLKSEQTPPLGNEPLRLLTKMSMAQLLGNNPASNPYGSIGGVGYTYVKETRKTTDSKNSGSTLYQFSNTTPNYTHGSVRIDHPLNGKLLEATKTDDKGLIKEKETMQFNSKLALSYYGINFQDNVNLFPAVFRNNRTETLMSLPNVEVYFTTGMVARITILMHQLNAYDITLASRETTTDGITTKEDYTYNSQTLQLKDKKITTEPNNSVKYSYTYPNDYNCGVYAQMTTNNMLSSTVEEKIYRNDGYIGGTLTEYGYTKDNKIIIPQKRYFSEVISKMTNPVTFTCTSVNKSIYPSQNVIYQEYDTFGNPVYIIHNEVTNIVYLWGYQGQYLIAEIKNATYQEVKEALGNIAPESLSIATTPNMALINGLRTHAKTLKAHVSTFTYTPLVGMLTSTDPSGIITYYDYDSFGRLKETYIIESGVKKIVQSYNYNYKNK